MPCGQSLYAWEMGMAERTPYLRLIGAGGNDSSGTGFAPIIGACPGIPGYLSFQRLRRRHRRQSG